MVQPVSNIYTPSLVSLGVRWFVGSQVQSTSGQLPWGVGMVQGDGSYGPTRTDKWEDLQRIRHR